MRRGGPTDPGHCGGSVDAAQPVCDCLRSNNLTQVRLAGHSYGGMVISQIADRMPERIARLVYVNAFVPNPGECLNAMVPPHYKQLFDGLAALQISKLYLNCQQDAAMPHSMPWHPRLSERLGLFRLVECQGSHEIWFTDPATLADALIRAGRD